LGSLNYQTKQFPAQGYECGDKKSTVKFIKSLQNKYKERRILLNLEGASYQRYGVFRDYLSSVNRDKEPENLSITCILLAPNAPEQNPVEDIWLQTQIFLRKYWYLGFAE
jgi:hypothetical protein